MNDSREILPPERPERRKVTVISYGPGGQTYTVHKPSKLQLLKWGIVALLAFSVMLAFFLAAFAIGLLLAIPLIVLALFRVFRIGWQLRKY